MDQTQRTRRVVPSMTNPHLLTLSQEQLALVAMVMFGNTFTRLNLVKLLNLTLLNTYQCPKTEVTKSETVATKANAMMERLKWLWLMIEVLTTNQSQPHLRMFPFWEMGQEERLLLRLTLSEKYLKYLLLTEERRIHSWIHRVFPGAAPAVSLAEYFLTLPIQVSEQHR